MDRDELARVFMTELLRKAEPDNIAPPATLADFAVQCADALIWRLNRDIASKGTVGA